MGNAESSESKPSEPALKNYLPLKYGAAFETLFRDAWMLMLRRWTWQSVPVSAEVINTVAAWVTDYNAWAERFNVDVETSNRDQVQYDMDHRKRDLRVMATMVLVIQTKKQLADAVESITSGYHDSSYTSRHGWGSPFWWNRVSGWHAILCGPISVLEGLVERLDGARPLTSVARSPNWKVRWQAARSIFSWLAPRTGTHSIKACRRRRGGRGYAAECCRIHT